MRLNIKKCRAQTYDGAGNMAGKQQGAVNQLKLKTDNENATSFHCAFLELNLALLKSPKVPDIYNMICLLQALGKFFVNSPKHEQEHERCIKSNVEEKQFNIMKKKIKPLCETRWLERHTAFEDLHVLYKRVLDCLSNMKNNSNRMWDPKTVVEASGILNQMTEAKFFISFHTWKFLLGFTKPLSTALQGSDMDVVNGYASVTTLTNELKEI